MKVELIKRATKTHRSFWYKLGICYVGKLIEPCPHYQIGVGFDPFKTLYLNLNRKPKFSNLVALNVLGMPLFAIYAVIAGLVICVVVFLCAVAYLLGEVYYECWNDLSERKFIFPILFWQLTAIALLGWILLS